MLKNAVLWTKKSLNQNTRALISKRVFSSKNVEPVRKPEEPIENPDTSIHKRMQVPTTFEKKLLVWTKRYTTAEEIPREVSTSTLSLAYNKGRIKCANYMMLATVFGCMLMIYLGKQAAERGESIQKMNLDWHKSMKESK